jgi:hypothetical protein
MLPAAPAVLCFKKTREDAPARFFVDEKQNRAHGMLLPVEKRDVNNLPFEVIILFPLFLHNRKN